MLKAVAALVAIVVVSAVIVLAGNAKCSIEYWGSDFSVRWRPFSGCQLQTNKGWLPSRHVREF